jgi:small subunit ribosomal protein S6
MMREGVTCAGSGALFVIPQGPFQKPVLMADRTYPYELTYAISGVLSDKKTQQTIDDVSDYIAGNGGDVEEVDEWGSQRLAYRIDGKRSGFYVRAHFEAPGELVPTLERRLQLNDDILRYLVLRMDSKMQLHQHTRRQREDEEAAAEAAEEVEAAEEPEEADAES